MGREGGRKGEGGREEGRRREGGREGGRKGERDISYNIMQMYTHRNVPI